MRSITLIAAVAVLISFSGCGGGAPAPKNREPVFPVKGKVSYQGKPVVGADIVYKSESVDRSAFGRTNDQGEFELSTFGANDGAVAGKHTVVISKSAAATAAPEAPVESADYVPPGFEKVKPAAAKAAKVENPIPAKYARPETSGLIATVNDDGSPNTANFELND